jgi:hypothetical protein
MHPPLRVGGGLVTCLALHIFPCRETAQQMKHKIDINFNICASKKTIKCACNYFCFSRTLWVCTRTRTSLKFSHVKKFLKKRNIKYMYFNARHKKNYSAHTSIEKNFGALWAKGVQCQFKLKKQRWTPVRHNRGQYEKNLWNYRIYCVCVPLLGNFSKKNTHFSKSSCTGNLEKEINTYFQVKFNR